MANVYPPEMLDISKGILLIGKKERMKVSSVKKRLSELVNMKNFFMMQNGRILHDSDELVRGNVYLIQRLPGGKGGFGSMLRAIGAQIEKTTNREACRDLSGRRLRDINEEKRLKSWINQQSDREREVEERKTNKLQPLTNEPNHLSNDHNYARARVELGPNVTDAVDQGMQAGASHQVSRKRRTLLSPKKLGNKRQCLSVDSELASDTSSSASESVADVADISDIVPSSHFIDTYFKELGDDYSEKSYDDDDGKTISNDSTDVDSDDSETSVHSDYLQSDSSYDELLDESYYPEEDKFPYDDTEDSDSSDDEDSESNDEEDSESNDEEDSESSDEDLKSSDEEDSKSSDESASSSKNCGSESKITQPPEKDMERLEK